jgi:PRTRC genetic system protein F
LGQTIPLASKAKSAHAAVDGMLKQHLLPGAHAMQLLDGSCDLEDPCIAEGSEDDCGFDPEEATLAYTPYATQEIVNIGPTLARLEAAKPGLGQTVYARLKSAASAAPTGVVTPADVHGLIEGYWWSDVPFSGDNDVGPTRLDSDIDYDQADALARTFLTEDLGWENGDDLPVPSLVDKELGGGFSRQFFLNPKDTVTVTPALLKRAGFDQHAAKELARLLQHDLPEWTAKTKHIFKRMRNFSSSHCVMPVVLTFGAEDMCSSRIVDEMVNDRMNNGLSDCSVRISGAPRLVNLRKGRRAYSAPPRKKRADAIRVMATYINLLSHVDQALVALRA